MKFILEVDMAQPKLRESAAAELGRILRYWGGNLRHYDLVPGDRESIYDSSYTTVGQWAIVDDDRP